jgi:hypothetical protein
MLKSDLNLQILKINVRSTISWFQGFNVILLPLIEHVMVRLQRRINVDSLSYTFMYVLSFISGTLNTCRKEIVPTMLE